ncbi:hypothetical protein JW998_09990 [candidate division KSB1 bacterium]|nr:hypothetical protein [candidate division KSB1 bacterium]
MKLITWRSVITLFIFFNTCTVIAQDADSLAMSAISLNAFVRQSEVPQNRTVELVIRLHWSGDLDRYEVHAFDDPILQNLQIQGSGSTNRVASENGVTKAIREYTFTFKPEAIGMGYIESFIVKYTDLSSGVEHRLTTNRIPVKVIDPIPDAASKAWIVPVLIVLVAGGAFLVVQNVRKKKAARQKNQVDSADAVAMEEEYLQLLRESVDLNEPTLNGGKSFSDISRLLRRFLHERFDAPGLEATTTQVIDSLSDRKLNDRVVNEIKEILTSADISKFSGKAVDRANLERAYTIVESILQKSLRGEIL